MSSRHHSSSSSSSGSTALGVMSVGSSLVQGVVGSVHDYWLTRQRMDAEKEGAERQGITIEEYRANQRDAMAENQARDEEAKMRQEARKYRALASSNRVSEKMAVFPARFRVRAEEADKMAAHCEAEAARLQKQAELLAQQRRAKMANDDAARWEQREQREPTAPEASPTSSVTPPTTAYMDETTSSFHASSPGYTEGCSTNGTDQPPPAFAFAAFHDDTTKGDDTTVTTTATVVDHLPPPTVTSTSSDPESNFGTEDVVARITATDGGDDDGGDSLIQFFDDACTVEPVPPPTVAGTTTTNTTKTNDTSKTCKFCTQCGERVTETAKFCSECGTRL